MRQTTNTETSLPETDIVDIAPEKKMIGRRHSSSNGPFSGAMCNLLDLHFYSCMGVVGNKCPQGGPYCKSLNF